jgi:glycosyltransferase involved in cell wall biosynthesis
MTPLISIVMPIYNCAEYLSEALRSVLNQSFTDFEIIIIDDGSADEPEKIVRSFNDARIRWYQCDHAGLVHQLNFGLQQASGEFIARMDGDDVMIHHRLEVQIKFLRSNPSVGVLGSSYIAITQQGQRDRIYRFPLSDREIKDAFPVYNPISHPSVMYKRSLVLEVGGYREQYFTAEDFDLWLRLLDRTGFANIDEPLLLKREQNSSVTLQQQTRTKNIHLTLAKDYIQHKKNLTSDKHQLFEWNLKLAKCEYYYGSISIARIMFAKLFLSKPFHLVVVRYLLTTLIREDIKNDLSHSRFYKFMKKKFPIRHRKILH